MTVERQPFEEIDHPADIALRARGATMPDLFANAGRGMVSLMVNPDTVTPRESRPVEVTGSDAEALLVAWLGEILFAFDADRFVTRDVVVDSLDAERLRGRLVGEPLDTARHGVRNLIKAVTWHDLTVTATEGGCEATIIFDV